MSTADLPEELLQAVLENLAYNPEFIERENPRFRWKYARSELFSLSVVSRQFRRLCLPFLFAYVEIKGKDLRNFSEQCATFASLSGLSLSMTLTHPVETTTNEPA
ncbi:hypothetical protein BT96DRAFT_990547 [Gymnopus androsaceus JB14]|uniref:Uncharacterized protein n=1 Tax=Gymnopus androsaceus JB14 TaxID=1447944 RepID=A0A6A4I2S6_9AGAR|nr:hypothetical protein BT96DRAFT_990547 [Gymnopus androsaceus JB14]